MIFNQDTESDKFRELLVGRKIIKAEAGEFENESTDAWFNNRAAGKLTLDDSTILLVHPNEGCGGCSAGWYYLTSLATVPNVITDVELVDYSPEPDQYGFNEEVHTYRLYVIADNEKINAMQIDGNDGNGYYGTGFELYVFPPDKDKVEGR